MQETGTSAEEIKDDQMGLYKKAKKIIGGGRTSKVCDATGWSKSRAKAEMKKARDLGVSNFNYVSKAAYELGPEELEEFGKTMKGLKVAKEKDNDFYVDIVCMRSGWSREEALAKMKKANRQGLSFIKYAQRGCWLKSEDEIKELARIAETEEKTVDEKKSEYIAGIMERTGWSRGKTELEIAKERLRLGASYEDFYRFRFDEISQEEREKYPTLRLMNKLRLRYCSYVPRSKYFDDKAEFNRTFNKYVKRVWFTNKGLEYEDFLEKIRNVDSVLVKPITSTCGIGISKHDCNVSEEANRKLYDFIMAAPDTLVEEYIVQHEDMMKLCPTSVNTIRINTMRWQGECIFQFAIVRTGCGSIVDNFHNGGIAARIDLDTGIVNADAVDLDGNIFETNPYSGIKLRGYQIPHWQEIIDTTREMSSVVDDVDYVGWDFAITPEGIDLIEGNEGAYVMPQMCNMQDRNGLRPLLADPYMKEYM